MYVLPRIAPIRGDVFIALYAVECTLAVLGGNCTAPADVRMLRVRESETRLEPPLLAKHVECGVRLRPHLLAFKGDAPGSEKPFLFRLDADHHLHPLLLPTEQSSTVSSLDTTTALPHPTPGALRFVRRRPATADTYRIEPALTFALWARRHSWKVPRQRIEGSICRLAVTSALKVKRRAAISCV